MPSAYEVPWPGDRHLVVAVGLLALGIWAHAVPLLPLVIIVVGGSVGAGVVAGVLGSGRLLAHATAGPSRVPTVVLAVAVLLVGTWRGGHAWAATVPDRLGPYAGWVTVVDDPVPIGAGVRVALEVEGERFRATVFGGGRHRVARMAAGERVAVVGERLPLSGRYLRSARARHLVGEFRIDRVADTTVGTPLSRAGNRVRALLRSGADRTMEPADAALFTGLVIGDDSRQPPALLDVFRTSGLSHLTAVSGQNVGQLIAFAGIALRRLPRWPRLVATLALIGWFAVVTRLEPSVLRAGTMAGLAAVAAATGRERGPDRILMLAVALLLVVDPLLLWSVGFWLSVGATVGVVVVAPQIERRLGGPRWFAAAVSIALGAQLGVLLPSLLVFGRVPLLGLPANLLAVPVAGAVMLLGLPSGLLAGAAPGTFAELLMLPCELGTRWVALVARLTAAVEPSGLAAVPVVVVQALVLLALFRAGRRDEVAESPSTRGTMSPP